MKKEMFEWIDWNSGVTEAWSVATSKTDGVALTAVVSLAVTFTAQALALPTAMSREEYHACALREEGTVLCWGSKLDGHQASPGEGYKFTSVSSGRSHGCALRDDGAVLCWRWP